MARKGKKEKPPERTEGTAEGAGKEVDAVKGFIFVMIVLILALGVLLIITMSQVDKVDTAIARTRSTARTLARTAREIQGYLKLISESGDKLLIDNPERFFKSIYAQPDVGISDDQVDLTENRPRVNHRQNYTEISWDLSFDRVSLKQVTQFLWGVENKSPKARTLQVSVRREKKQGPETWKADASIGFRIAGKVAR